MPKKRKRKRGKKKLLFLRRPKDQRSVDVVEDVVREATLRLRMKKIPIWRFECQILSIFYNQYTSCEFRVKIQCLCYFPCLL